MRNIYIIIIFFIPFILSAQEGKIPKYCIDVNLEQSLFSFSGINYYAYTKEYFQQKTMVYPSFRIEGIKLKNSKRRHSLSVGLFAYSMSYSQRAFDIEFYNYPSNIEYRTVYYHRDFRVINLIFGYKYYLHLNKQIMIFGGLDYLIPVNYYSNNKLDNVIVGYGYSGSDIELSTRHKEFQAVELSESFVNGLSIPFGIIINVNKKVSLGIDCNYKFSGNLLAFDNMQISYEKGDDKFNYIQDVALYNSYLNLSFLIKYRLY